MIVTDKLINTAPSSPPLNVGVEAIYKNTNEICAFVERKIVPQLIGLQMLSTVSDNKLSEKDIAILGIYERMYHWIRSLMVLNNRHLFQEAASATRSLVELFLDFRLLLCDRTGDYVKKYFEFLEMSKTYSAKIFVSSGDQFLGQTKLAPAQQRAYPGDSGRQSRVKRNVQFLWETDKNGLPRFPRHWSGMDLRARALYLDGLFQLPMHEELYGEMYQLGSMYIHPDPFGHISLDKATFESIYGLCHSIAQGVFLEATILCAKEMTIDKMMFGFNERVEELRNKFPKKEVIGNNGFRFL